MKKGWPFFLGLLVGSLVIVFLSQRKPQKVLALPPVVVYDRPVWWDGGYWVGSGGSWSRYQGGYYGRHSGHGGSTGTGHGGH